MGFLGEAAEFLNKHSGKIAIGLTAVAFILGGATLFGLPIVVGFVGFGFAGGAVLFGGHSLIKQYGDYRENEANKAREEEMANQQLKETRNEVKLYGAENSKKMQNTKSALRNDELLLRITQMEAKHDKDLEQVYSKINVVDAKVASFEEQQRIASYHESLKELHEEKDKNKDMLSSDSDSNHSDSEGKGSSSPDNSKPSSSEGKDIVSGGSMFTKSPRSGAKTTQKSANDSSVMGITTVQK